MKKHRYPIDDLLRVLGLETGAWVADFRPRPRSDDPRFEHAATMWFPGETALIRAVAATGVGSLPAIKQAVQRAKAAGGLSPGQAEAWSYALGFHIAEVWTEYVDHEIERHEAYLARRHASKRAARAKAKVAA